MKEATKIQELVYELKLRDVMKKDVVSVAPDMRMSDLRELFRARRISGAPVLDADRLVGIISIEDFIRWLSDGAESRISEKMTKKVETFYDDEVLVHVLNKMGTVGFGRFPIIDRQTNRMCGIVTKGNIIEGLLKKIEIDYHEEEIRKYRASHIFEDISADKATLIFQYRIAGKKLSEAGEPSSALKTTLKRLGFHPDIVRRSAIIAYEAETNVIIHGKEGKMIVKVDPAEIYMKIEDKGAGIPDVEKALEPGFSTAPDWARELGFGAGMGLPNIKKCSDKMVLNSTVGKGTCLEATVDIRQPQ